jgi:hypothetical protein
LNFQKFLEQIRLLPEKPLIHKIVKIRAIMGATDKFNEFLKSKDEQYLTSLKEYFFECFQVTTDEKGDYTVNTLNAEQIERLFTVDYITNCFVRIPGGYTDFLDLVDESIDPISEILLNFMKVYFVDKLDSSIFNMLKDEIDIGSDEALIALVSNALKKFGQEDLSSTKQEYQILKKILINFNGNIFKLLMQASLSIHLRLFGSAKMQIQHAFKTLLYKLTPYNHSVVELSTVKKKAKQAGEKGSKKRWALKRKIKEESFRLRDEMKVNGKFRNNMQASKSLTSNICQFAEEIGAPFTEPFTAQMGIYKWFREEKK